ncbi:MAG: DNA glycosylase [Actinomycetota bacterium]|nr:DNA glycosylase [Actinomycetota bacterium]
MPEGDTVYLAATRLNGALAGQPLTKTDFRVPRFATMDLSGRRIRHVAARGKHLLFRIEDGVTLHTHFMMDGAWRLYRPGERWRGPAFQARAVLETPPWVAVGFKLAVTELIPTAGEHEIVGHLGPDLLGPDWDPSEALRRLKAQGDRPLGDALLDQTVMAGLGNVYKCEVCWLKGLDPWLRVSDAGDLKGVVDLAKRLIEANRTIGSQVTTGDLRRGRGQWVYARAGRPCRRCGTPIRRRHEGGERVTYWCPHCQPP